MAPLRRQQSWRDTAWDPDCIPDQHFCPNPQKEKSEPQFGVEIWVQGPRDRDHYRHYCAPERGDSSRQVQLLKPSPPPGSTALPFAQSPVRCTTKGDDERTRGMTKEQGRLQNCSFLPSRAKDFLQRPVRALPLDTVFLLPWP